MRDAELNGGHGRAWKRRSPPTSVQQIISSWIVDWRPNQGGVSLVGEGRGWYAVSVVALRGPRVGRIYPTAEYELQIVPCKKYQNPDGPGYEAAGDPELIAQFNGDMIGDDAARAIGDAIAMAVVKAGIPPKRERAGEWDKFVGDIMGKFGVAGQIRWA